jgi:hypothetical protein
VRADLHVIGGDHRDPAGENACRAMGAQLLAPSVAVVNGHGNGML